MRIGPPSLPVEMVTFTPKQVEEITGLTTVRQRDLRRHGYLTTQRGHARYDVIDLAEMLVIKLMLDHGVRPAEAKKISRICSLGIGWNLFHSDNSYGGDYALVTKEHAPVDWIAKEIEEDKASFFRSHIFNIFRVKEIIPDEQEDYFIWWADGTYSWYQSIDEEITNIPIHDERRTGPMIILSMKSLSFEIKRQAGSIFAKVKIMPTGGDDGL